jgi:hypothetical protein
VVTSCVPGYCLCALQQKQWGGCQREAGPTRFNSTASAQCRRRLLCRRAVVLRIVVLHIRPFSLPDDRSVEVNASLIAFGRGEQPLHCRPPVVQSRFQAVMSHSRPAQRATAETSADIRLAATRLSATHSRPGTRWCTVVEPIWTTGHGTWTFTGTSTATAICAATSAYRSCSAVGASIEISRLYRAARSKRPWDGRLRHQPIAGKIAS